MATYYYDKVTRDAAAKADAKKPEVDLDAVGEGFQAIGTILLVIAVVIFMIAIIL